MKKILFCAGFLALVTSCADEDFLSSGAYNDDAKGISFGAVVADDVQSRGELSYDSDAKNFPFFWYAEQDVINVYAWDEVTGTKGVGSAWNVVNSTPASYKATQSKANGQFTAKNDADLLQFADSTANNNKPAQATFVATYKATLANVHMKDGVVDTLTINPTVGNADQNLVNTDVTAYMPMYSTSRVQQDKVYHSVGEKINLKFYRYGAIAGFTSTGIDATNKTLFGKLDSIKLTMLGNDTLPASAIAYTASSEYKIVVNAPVDFTKSEIKQTSGATVKATYQKAFGDGDVAYMALAPVNRAIFKTKKVNEYYRIEYFFQNITFTTDSLTTSNNWASASNGVMDMAKLDINKYDYLVTNNGALIVNKGSFANVFTNATTINWGAGGTPVTAINTIISKVALTDAEAQMLTRFTNLKSIELAENTSLPKETFTATQAAAIESLVMPKVTTIDKAFIKGTNGAFDALETLKLAAYEFENPDVNKAFFNSNTQYELEVLDMSGVTNMLPTFGIDRSLSFEDYDSLTTIIVQDGMKVAPKGFKDCDNLKTITGKIDLINGEEAFAGDTALAKINITGTVIPQAAFNGAKKLSEVLYNNAQVAPTKVKKNGLNGTAIKYMDLANLTEAGESAFAGSALTAPNKNTVIMKIGATTIGAYAFENTKMTMVNFTAATTIAKGMLKQTTATLKHLKFTKAFTYNVGTATSVDYDEPFGPNANIDLFLNPDQNYMDGTTMKLPKATVNYTFKTVQYE